LITEAGVPARSAGRVEHDGRVDRDAATLELDHVLIAVPDLANAARVFDERYGLASIEGGRHPNWGTANRIVPAGDAYLELVAVVDDERASVSAFGRWVASARRGLIHPFGWAVRTTSIDDVAARLDLQVASGSRSAPDGRTLEWRTAGVDDSADDPSLPFFIEWGRDTPHPSAAMVSHPAGTVEISALELGGDAAQLSTWLGDHSLPVVIRPGLSAVKGVVLRGSDGREIRIETTGG
jgi:hypothetical protein